MNRKEVLILAIGVFMTIVAWMLIDLYHIRTAEYIDRDIPAVYIPTFEVDTKVFPTLAEKKP